MIMNTNQKSDQGSKQSERSGTSSSQPGAGSSSSGSRSGTQGGTHEQHVEAGKQSHKNDSASSNRQNNKK
jgi:hypothetical protein